ncbi:MAG TPA: cache domain-containing protein [Syntrophales bacterium]|nr:cache domain-containing protein [Syntrophales bacterium]
MLEKSKKVAKGFVANAINFYKSSGKDIALAEFTNTKGPFVQEEMYIFVLDQKGAMIAHGVNEKYINKNFIDLKDSDGKSFIREIIDTAGEKGSGFVEYKWYNPVTKEMKPKRVYFEKVDDLIFCGGIYVEKWLDLISYNLQATTVNLTTV